MSEETSAQQSADDTKHQMRALFDEVNDTAEKSHQRRRDAEDIRHTEKEVRRLAHANTLGDGTDQMSENDSSGG